ncbi:MAG: beta-glucosidase [Neolewinella sp.]
MGEARIVAIVAVLARLLMQRRLAVQLTTVALLAIGLSGCTLHKPVVQNQADIICRWGSLQFDLCVLPSDVARIAALLSEMTLDEKIGQMTQSIWHNGVTPEIIKGKTIGSVIHTEGPTPGALTKDWLDLFDQFQRQAMSTRLGIPLLIAVDAVHGQNTFEGAVIFPHNIGMAATRNMSLVKAAAQVTAKEVAGTGFNWTFSPCIAMPEHEHWGRVYEGFSEDRDLTIAAVKASVVGHQGADLAARNTIAATAKHYIGDGATQGGVEGGNAVIDDQRLREIYLPPYAAAVDAGVAAVMVGFNSVNGINMHQHRRLVTEVLKGELGFEGVVVTDWDGGLRFGAAHTVINAGIDLAMQPGNHEDFIADLKSSVEDGTVSQARIDDAVTRILRLKFRLGLFTDPYAKREFSETVGSAPHRALARQAVRESLVLLKSENDALPLKPRDHIEVVGEHAVNTGLQSGGWSIHWQGQTQSYSGATSIYQGLVEVAKEDQAKIELATKGCNAQSPADKAVVVVGEQPYAEGAGDSDELWLSDAHKKLISDCKSLGRKVIVVLVSGRVLVISPELNLSDAFVAAWLPGSEGAGIADFLFAKDGFKPTGKSPYAWPLNVSDLPLSKYDSRALFPFGYGLHDY